MNLPGLPKHGSPADRGSADSYYNREPRPHKMVDDRREFLAEGTPEWDEYTEAYEINESAGNFKNWG